MNRIQCGLAYFAPNKFLRALIWLGIPIWAVTALDWALFRYPSCAICEQEIGINPFCDNCNEFVGEKR